MKIADTMGIVICGGHSGRMKTDKGMLDYHGQPQYQHTATLLQPFCHCVSLSINETQQDNYREAGLPLMTDLPEYQEIGPMAALLTAGWHFPGRNFLVLGCDYPLLGKEELATFVQSVNHSTIAAAFYNVAAKIYEPLLAYYTAEAVQQMTKQAGQYRYSLQRFLRSLEAEQYLPRYSESIESVDDPETAAAVWRKISMSKAAGRPEFFNFET